MAAPMKPLADDEAVLQVGGVTIENGLKRITILGLLDLGRYKRGLAAAKVLKSSDTQVRDVWWPLA